MGLVTNNQLRRVPLTHSITLHSEKQQLRVGACRQRVAARMEAGSRVRLMVCVATGKFRVYVDGHKQATADFPPHLASA